MKRALYIIAVLSATIWLQSCKNRTEHSDESLSLTIPEAETQELQKSKSEAYYRDRGQAGMSYEDYFDSLISSDEKDTSGTINPDNVFEDIVKEEVEDVIPETRPKKEAHSRVLASSSTGMKVELERHTADTESDDLKNKEEALDTKRESGSEPRQIAISDPDDIISCLDDEDSSSVIHYKGQVTVRCAIIDGTSVKSGDRVSIRILENLVTPSITIPANSRLTAICTISGNRLLMDVPVVHIDNKMIPLGYKAYDRDGLLGLYAPESTSADTVQELGRDGLDLVTSTLGSVLGSGANTVLRSGARALTTKRGSEKVGIRAGYEFYLFNSGNDD